LETFQFMTNFLLNKLEIFYYENQYADTVKIFLQYNDIRGGFLSRKIQSFDFKMSLDWVMLGTFPTIQKFVF
jgi:hypothetical protein